MDFSLPRAKSDLPTRVRCGLPRIRGVGALTASAEIENSVTTDVNVIISIPYSSFMSLNKVRQPASQMGPQGASFGINTDNDLIQSTSLNPKSEDCASAEVCYGNFDTILAKTFVTGSLGTDIDADLAVYYQNENGCDLTTDANPFNQHATVRAMMTRNCWSSSNVLANDNGR